MWLEPFEQVAVAVVRRWAEIRIAVRKVSVLDEVLDCGRAFGAHSASVVRSQVVGGKMAHARRRAEFVADRSELLRPLSPPRLTVAHFLHCIVKDPASSLAVNPSILHAWIFQ